uniref:Uncharacterized protein n=1 Tax=Arundo donax TaxID=35708 RepID=A0A0A9E284_ARUDO
MVRDNEAVRDGGPQRRAAACRRLAGAARTWPAGARRPAA